MRSIHVRKRRGKWNATWRNKRGRPGVTRYADTAEHALISLLGSEVMGSEAYATGSNAYATGAVLRHVEFVAWLESQNLMGLRRSILFAKGKGWDDVTRPEGVRMYRKWQRERRSGTSLALGE